MKTFKDFYLENDSKMIKEIFEKEEYTIFCDLDGVLVDFASKAKSVVGDTKFNSNEFWKKINEYAKDHNFFNDMRWMPEAENLWKYINDNFKSIHILSATGKIPNAEKQKKEWVRKHLGNVSAIFVPEAVSKSEHATIKSILVDDREKAINPWINAGGIGILHESVSSSIKKLKGHH